MTYKEIVDTLRDIAQRHHMIYDFGYGELSDIKTKSQDTKGGDAENTDYPYLFVNPTPHQRTEGQIAYRFNLILMDMAVNDTTNSNILKIQSECQQYLDDILAELKYTYVGFDIDLNVTLTPFKERFQDTVAGMTASIELLVPVPLNSCIAPIQ